MPVKRKIRNLPTKKDQVSFFEPVYSNDSILLNDEDEDEDENGLLAEGVPRAIFDKETNDDLNETYDTDTITNNDQDPSSNLMSASKIISRIKQIQCSIEQAEGMLESMEQFKNFVPDNDGQYEKLRSLIVNLQEQQASYINLLNLITSTVEEPSATNNINATSDRQIQMTRHDDDNDLSLRRHVQLRMESKTGSMPQTISLSDNEQTNRNDNSNYDSLVGSLKSDTLNLQDQQATSDDEETDIESDKEMEKNLMLQKEQLRALQGQKRALIALKRRSEKGLIKQQQLMSKKSTTTNEETNLLSDISNIRNRLKVLRELYEKKYQHEIQQLKNSSNKPQIETESRLQSLEHVRERLDELEQVVTRYREDLNDVEDSSQLDDVSYLQTYLQEKSQTTPKQLDKVSNELAAKRLELEQAKSALAQLQQMVKRIQPDEYSSSTQSTPMQKRTPSRNTSFEFSTTLANDSTQPNQIETIGLMNKPSFLSHILSSSQPSPNVSNSVDSKMLAQHREIERLIESRQRLHSIKDQIACLQQTITTPSKPNETNVDRLNDSKNLRPSYKSYHEENLNRSDNDLDVYPLDDQSESEEESDDGKNINYTTQFQQTQAQKKQTNFCTTIPKNEQSNDELNQQMREICQCLSAFIDEQKTFNRNIEQRLTSATNSSLVPTVDLNFAQIQQQNLTQSLIVNLNTAYREIAVLQSEMNALQSENIRLTSSLSFDNQYHQQIPYTYSRNHSKESIYSLDRINPSIRPQPRSKFYEQQQQHRRTTNNPYENSIKTSPNSQTTRKPVAIQTKPIKYGQNSKFSTECLSSPQLSYLNSKRISTTNDSSNQKDNIVKSFVIHRRPISKDNENKDVYNYKQSSSVDDYQRTSNNQYGSDNEQKTNDFLPHMFSTQPLTSTAHDLENVDIQTLDLQVKSIMVQLIPFMRLRIDDIFNRSILNHTRERILFLFKQQPDSAEFIRHFQNQFSALIEKTIEKYIGISIRECAADLIREISDLAFDELVKYKIYENTNNLQTKTRIEQTSQLSEKQEDEYSPMYEQQELPFDDGDNDDKYHIELAESENRPLTLIGSDEEDNDADQEENTDTELETAVSRQGTYFDDNESPIPTNLKLNGHEYILVNGSENNTMPENEDQSNEEINI